MKLNFKQAVFGATIALVTNTAFAAVIAPAVNAKYSKEGVALKGGSLTLGTLNVTLGANYSFNDIIEVVVNGAELAQGTSQTAVLSCPTSPTTPLPSTRPDALRFRIADPSGATTNESCTIQTLALVGSSVASGAGKFGVCWTGFFGSTTDIIDEGCTADTALTASQQTGAKVNTPFNEVIDVATKNFKFVAGGLTDALQLSITSSNTGFTQPFVDVQKETITINGDFGWVDGTDAGTTCSVTEFNAVATITPAAYTVQNTSTCAKLVIAATGTTVLSNQIVDLTLTIPGTEAIPPQVYAGDVLFNYVLNGQPDAGTRSVPLDYGSWTLNGAQVYINYMPYNGVGGNISRIVYVSNRGSLAGNIAASVFSESGGTSCDFVGGSIGPGEIKQLSKAMDDAVFLCFGNTFSGKVHAIISVTAPKNSIEVYSAYNVGGSDRGTVVNTSNGRIVTGGNSQ